jgi:hypothetical protein
MHMYISRIGKDAHAAGVRRSELKAHCDMFMDHTSSLAEFTIQSSLSSYICIIIIITTRTLSADALNYQRAHDGEAMFYSYIFVVLGVELHKSGAKILS